VAAFLHPSPSACFSFSLLYLLLRISYFLAALHGFQMPLFPSTQPYNSPRAIMQSPSPVPRVSKDAKPPPDGTNRVPGLREHLLAAGAGQPTPTQQPMTPHQHPQHPQQHPHSAGPQHVIDPAISGSPYAMDGGDANDGHLSEGQRKGRRELSTSKRAAQNRAAQVCAFDLMRQSFANICSARSVIAKRNTSRLSRKRSKTAN
jgi:hypothetical protein